MAGSGNDEIFVHDIVHVRYVIYEVFWLDETGEIVARCSSTESHIKLTVTEDITH